MCVVATQALSRSPRFVFEHNLSEKTRCGDGEQHENASQYLRLKVGFFHAYMTRNKVVRFDVALKLLNSFATRRAAQPRLSNGRVSVGAQRADVLGRTDADARIESSCTEQTRLFGANFAFETAPAERNVVQQVVDWAVLINERSDNRAVQSTCLAAYFERVCVSVETGNAFAYPLVRSVVVVR